MSTIPFLVAAVVLFPAFVGRRAFRESAIDRSELNALYGYSVLMSCWLAFAAFAGYQGWLLDDQLLATVPGLWLPLVPVAVVMFPLLIPMVRRGLFRAGRSIPWMWFAWIQALRIAAIGTAIKTYRGEFPETVEYWMGVPDLLFGLSAIWVARLAAQGKISQRMWIIWNAIGFAIIVPIGMIVINMSLPGPFNVFTETPSFLVAFEFPLSLAPTAIVPWLVVFNLWAIVSAMAFSNE